MPARHLHNCKWKFLKKRLQWPEMKCEGTMAEREVIMVFRTMSENI
jgi:hypothetical protein